MSESLYGLSYPQFFTTHIVGGVHLPGLEITTMGGFSYEGSQQELIDNLLKSLEEEPSFHWFGKRSFGIAGYDEINGLQIVERLLDSSWADSTDRVTQEVVQNAARNIYTECPIAIVNSPLSGKTLQAIFQTTSSGGVLYFFNSLHSPLGTFLAIAFVGTTPIIFGAAHGIGSGLEQALSKAVCYHLLRFLKVPNAATAKASAPTDLKAGRSKKKQK